MAEPDVQTQITTERLLSDYGASIDELGDTQLPETRIEESVRHCIDTQQRLSNHGTVDRETALELVASVAEAMDEVRGATVVTPENLPESRALDSGVPTDNYLLTTEERDVALDALSSLPFTLVETPTTGVTTTPAEIAQ